MFASSSLASTCSRRLYHEDHLFFVEGNLERYSKFVAHEEVGDGDGTAMATSEVLEENLNRLECSHKGCGLVFHSIVAYSSHYRSHYAQCITCDQMFPNVRVMDIHILESHSSYFEVQSAKVPSFVCLVDGCIEVFWNQTLRDEHLRHVHDIASSAFSGLSSKATGSALLKEKIKSKKKKGAVNLPLRICRFISGPSGCRNGDECAFLHEVRPSPLVDMQDEMPPGISVDSLIHGFQQIAVAGGAKERRRKVRVQL
jgi:hypothetical protein